MFTVSHMSKNQIATGSEQSGARGDVSGVHQGARAGERAGGRAGGGAHDARQDEGARAGGKSAQDSFLRAFCDARALKSPRGRRREYEEAL